MTIDGFFANQFHALLFAQTILNVDTHGELVWQQQAGDIGKYIGHRAYIEIEDAGDGYIAVDEIRFAGGDPPKQAPVHPLVMELVDDERVNSIEALTAFYAKKFSDAIERWRRNELSADDSRFVDWMLQLGLLDFGDTTKKQLVEGATRIDQLAAAAPGPTEVLAMADGTGEDVKINVRGDPHKLGPTAARAFLTALSGDHAAASPTEGSGRLGLAEQMVRPDNPLISRVLVNRVWQHLLGRGIVSTVDNFGALGEPPTHPELLDYLATEFQTEGWSIKKLVRAIVLSRTYQMASESGQADAIDPANRLWHRADIRSTGRRGDSRRHARGFRPPQCGAVRAARAHPPYRAHAGPRSPRHKRAAGRRRAALDLPGSPPQFSGAADACLRRSSAAELRGARTASNVPAQVLAMLNDPFVHDQAAVWAKQVLHDPQRDDGRRVSDMYRAAFARNPSAEELAAAATFLEHQRCLHQSAASDAEREQRAWGDMCHALFNAKEFVYIQ